MTLKISAANQGTHLDGFIATPCSEKDALVRRAGHALTSRGYERHAVHITVVGDWGRVNDVLWRDIEFGAGCRRAWDHAMGIVDAIVSFEIRGPSL